MQNIKDSSFRKGFSYLRMAKEYFMDASRQGPRLASGQLAVRYTAKIEWIERDYKSSPKIPSERFYDLDQDMNIGDLMYHEDISKLAALLTISQKEGLVGIMERLIAGEETIVQIQ